LVEGAAKEVLAKTSIKLLSPINDGKLPQNCMIKKLTAKTVDEDPADCQRWISRKEI